jgi:hypothetical protein
MDVSTTLATIAPTVVARIASDPTGNSLPRGGVPGTNGMVFVTRSWSPSDGSTWTTVHVDGVPVWRGTDAPYLYWYHPASEWLDAAEAASSMVAEGHPFPYIDDQRGGFFTLSRSAPWWGEDWGSWTESDQQGERGDQPRRLPRKAGWREVEAA